MKPNATEPKIVTVTKKVVVNSPVLKNATQEQLVEFEMMEKFVTNWHAFNQWKLYVTNPILQKVIECSDGRLVKLHLLPHHLKKAIEGLPPEEQAKILKFKEIYHHVHHTGNVWKRKAFTQEALDDSKEFGQSSQSIIFPKREEILELFGRMYSLTEVHKVIVKDWKIPCSESAVERFRRTNMTTINEKIALYQRNYSDIRLGHKRSRLDELVWMYGKMKDKFMSSGSREEQRVMLSILEQIRKEVEGDSIRIDGTLDVNIEQTVNMHLQKEVFKEISITQIVIARVASKAGVDMMKMVNNLTNSYYSNYTGLVKPMDDGADEEFSFPSTEVYDFNKIGFAKQAEAKNNKIMIEAAKVDKEATLEKARGLGFKEKLLAKIAEKNKELQLKGNSVRSASANLEGDKASNTSGKDAAKGTKDIKGGKK